jgi:hypothetical protein
MDVVHDSVNIHSGCLYNTAVLIQSMQKTQRTLNKLWQNITQSADERWNTMTEMFEVSSL